jgi:hypothetical protein
MTRNLDNRFPKVASVLSRLPAPEAGSLRSGEWEVGKWGVGVGPGSLPRGASASPPGELSPRSSRGFGADASPSGFPRSLTFRAAPGPAEYGTLHPGSA